MALSDKMLQALNDQIQMEYHSAYVYLSMSAFCDSQGLPGSATWLKHQWHEEVQHTMKLIEYVQDRGENVTLQAIPQPQTTWDSALAVFENALEHEQKVTAAIHNLVSIARAENDYATDAVLQWFVTEQVEEEKSATDVVDMLRRAGDHPSAVIVVDQRMGSRTGSH